MLARFLAPPLAGRGEVVGVSRREGDETAVTCDLRDPAAVAGLLDEVRPDLLVHLAALTDVDGCETDPVAAYEANVRATANLVDWLSAHAPATRFIYVSTDQVYDAPGPSAEEVVRPRNVYALTKLWGEDHARRLAAALVLRLNFFAGPEAGLVGWLAQKCRAGEPVRLFSDVLFNPLHVDDLADCFLEMVDRGASGTFNLGGAGDGLTKAAFLRAAAAALSLPDRNLGDGSVADLQLPAYRPRDMRMKVGRAEALFGRSLPSVEDGLARLADDRVPAAH